MSGYPMNLATLTSKCLDSSAMLFVFVTLPCRQDILAVLDDVAGNGLCHIGVSARNLLQYDGPETDERR